MAPSHATGVNPKVKAVQPQHSIIVPGNKIRWTEEYLGL